MAADPILENPTPNHSRSRTLQAARSVFLLNKGVPMNPTRLRIIEQGQTSIAKKVLSCVPIQEVWPSAQILRELNRCGSRVDPRIFEGCLNTLVDAGLIKESPRAHFQRVHIPDEDQTPVATSPGLKAVPTQPTDPLSRLAAVAHSLRNIAGELEDIALVVESSAHSNDAELEKLRALKNLLKGL